MEEIYNRKIRIEPMTYMDALHLAWVVLDREARRLDEEDKYGQGLSLDYKQAILLLNELYLRKPSEVTNNYE